MRLNGDLTLDSLKDCGGSMHGTQPSHSGNTTPETSTHSLAHIRLSTNSNASSNISNAGNNMGKLQLASAVPVVSPNNSQHGTGNSIYAPFSTVTTTMNTNALSVTPINISTMNPGANKHQDPNRLKNNNMSYDESNSEQLYYFNLSSSSNHIIDCNYENDGSAIDDNYMHQPQAVHPNGGNNVIEENTSIASIDELMELDIISFDSQDMCDYFENDEQDNNQGDAFEEDDMMQYNDENNYQHHNAGLSNNRKLKLEVDPCCFNFDCGISARSNMMPQNNSHNQVTNIQPNSNKARTSYFCGLESWGFQRSNSNNMNNNQQTMNSNPNMFGGMNNSNFGVNSGGWGNYNNSNTNYNTYSNSRSMLG